MRLLQVRGIFRGAVFVRFLTNLLLLVGDYSPYMPLVRALPAVSDELQIGYVGCFRDAWDRDLPYQVHHYTAATLSPRRCLQSCNLLGYRYAGLQQFECWCGHDRGRHGQAEAGQCSAQCPAVSLGLLSGLLASAEKKAEAARTQPSLCGGGFVNSVYENTQPDTASAYQAALTAPAGVRYVKGRPDESCDAACAREGGGAQPLRRALLPPHSPLLRGAAERAGRGLSGVRRRGGPGEGLRYPRLRQSEKGLPAVQGALPPLQLAATAGTHPRLHLRAVTHGRSRGGDGVYTAHHCR